MPERAQDEFLKTVLEESPIGVAILDIASGKRLFANSRLVDLFGADSREALLNGAIEDTWVDPSDLQRAFSTFSRHERLVNFESRRRRMDGTLIWVLMNTQPIIFDNKDAGIVWHIDISDRKQAEVLLTRAKAEAEEASHAKSEFLVHVSHELRTPLNCILGFSEILTAALRSGNDQRNAGYARNIFESGQHLLGIINDILDISKIEAGEFELEESEFHLPEVLAAAQQMLRGLAEDSRVTVTCVPPAGDGMILYGDRRVTLQVVVNLLSNAIRFNRKDGSVRMSAAAGGDGGLSITVEDTGIGIAAEDIPKALAPFGQVRPGAHRSHGGTGLGLSLSKHLVELQGGRLDLTSEPGKGTTVVAAFPPSRTRRRT